MISGAPAAAEARRPDAASPFRPGERHARLRRTAIRSANGPARSAPPLSRTGRRRRCAGLPRTADIGSGGARPSPQSGRDERIGLVPKLAVAVQQPRPDRDDIARLHVRIAQSVGTDRLPVESRHRRIETERFHPEQPQSRGPLGDIVRASGERVAALRRPTPPATRVGRRAGTGSRRARWRSSHGRRDRRSRHCRPPARFASSGGKRSRSASIIPVRKSPPIRPCQRSSTTSVSVRRR